MRDERDSCVNRGLTFVWVVMGWILTQATQKRVEVSACRLVIRRLGVSHSRGGHHRRSSRARSRGRVGRSLNDRQGRPDRVPRGHALVRDVVEWQGHASLRFDADPSAVATFLVDVITSHSLKLFTTTESRSRALVREIRRRLPDHYRVTRRGEFLIIWHRPTFRSSRLAWLATLDPRSWPMLGGHRLFTSARIRFEHRPTSRRVRLEITHAPSGVDDGPGHWGTEFPERVRISQAGLERSGRGVARFHGRHPDGVSIVHLDSNLNVARDIWRTWLDHTLNSPSVWTLAGVPFGGTHGSRLIDDSHVLGIDVDRASIVTRARPPKLDHRPFVYRASYRHKGDS